jgi:4-diphosphocytidyl-2-C-methyl-D-erythritol kinase
VVLNAPAKVNLHLEIRGMRSDGYHEILSVVVAVSLFDRIHIRSLKHENFLRFRCEPPVPGATNIAAEAARLFMDASGIESGVDVRVHKRIPLGAGLGGGSSDAATVLRGLNRMFSNPLSSQRLRELAAGLGSDVCFFLGGAAALMSGRGERIRELTPRDDFLVVLVYPNFGISTAEAYGWFDRSETKDRRTSNTEELTAQFEGQDPHSWDFFNSFQPTIEGRYPVIAEIVEVLADCGAHPAVVSGSGSSVIGVFTNRCSARMACRRLRRRYAAVWSLVPLQSGGFAD